MFGAFDMPFEVTISELAIELLFPGERTTANAFQALARERALHRGPGTDVTSPRRRASTTLWRNICDQRATT
jgi:hypothetical protein